MAKPPSPRCVSLWGEPRSMTPFSTGCYARTSRNAWRRQISSRNGPSCYATSTASRKSKSLTTASGSSCAHPRPVSPESCSKPRASPCRPISARPSPTRCRLSQDRHRHPKCGAKNPQSVRKLLKSNIIAIATVQVESRSRFRKLWAAQCRFHSPSHSSWPRIMPRSRPGAPSSGRLTVPEGVQYVRQIFVQCSYSIFR